MSGDKRQPIEIHIDGLEVFAHHGLLLEEREVGQMFRFDLCLTLDDCPACAGDAIAGTVDYAAVIDRVVATATAESYFLLEKLAAVLAELILKEFPQVASVWIRAAKTSPPLSHSVDGVSVQLERSRPASAGSGSTGATANQVS